MLWSKSYVAVLCAVIFVLASGCKTSPPLESDTASLLTRVIITTELDSATVTVDGQARNKYAPDTLMLTPGMHTLKLERNGFTSVEKNIQVPKGVNVTIPVEFNTRVVLVEDFANVSCAPCVNSNLLIEKLKTGFLKENKMMIIKFATNWPSALDPFYNTIPELCRARWKYYNVTVVPTIVMNGEQKTTVPDSFEIKSVVKKLLAKPKKLDVAISAFTMDGASFTIEAKVTCLATADIDFANTAVYMALVEKEIHYPTAPGNNGETDFYNVVRSLLPDNNGIPLNVLANGESITLSKSGALYSNWNFGKLQPVVFVQNKLTKEIYNATALLK